MRIRCPNCLHGLEIIPDTPAEYIKCPSCGSQIDPNSGETVSYKPEPRKIIGHFELLDLVGRGHFGEVWRSRDTQLKRVVAVKIPRTSDLSESDRLLFLREAQTAANLRHDNIVRVYEVGYEGDTIFIVSDFIQGIPLSEQLKIRQPTFKEAARWCATIADALEYAHGQGVVHRDMKPGNIMLEGEDKLFVLDFGLAKTDGGDFTITTEGEILGTPAYMSPEQARGDAGSADRRSDVYSLGVVLYEMLTGERPFKGGTRSLVHQILNEDPKSPRHLKREVPRDLETICLKAMAKEPDRRYITAKEFADDLRRYLAGEPIHARPVRWPERSWRWMRRNPALSGVSAVAAAAVLLIFLQVGRWLIAGPPGPPRVLVQVSILKRETVDPKSATTPSTNSRVVFWPLDHRTGDPDLDNSVERTGQNPISVKLIPGDYLVVVDIPGHGFHEVYRHVLEPGEGQAGAYDHQICIRLDDGSLKLMEVAVPPQEIEVGMATFPEVDRFQMGKQGLDFSPPHDRRQAAFLLDPHEVTIDEFRKDWGGFLVEDRAESGKHALHHVNYDIAAAYAEKMGKRLPEESEYEAAATNYGKQEFPWGNDRSLIASWPREDVGIPTYDRTSTTIPVVGLFSNVAEWTASWGAYYPSERHVAKRDAPEYRIVRGAPQSVLHAHPFALAPSDGPRLRAFSEASQGSPWIGFRCARSAKPRLTRADFSRPLPEK